MTTIGAAAVLAPPPFFAAIRDRAANRWAQLESDAELAGPWHQLFKQVQSPRHILSELLQNADDAGATEAAVRIEDHRFVFMHDGEDFTEEHFTSLCRFGYSNKRALHTIGFRGIGFKSTFSLGDTVELHTPTLAVSFDRRRFTEPRWIDVAPRPERVTEVRVAIVDALREREVERNLQEWLASPISLLFFRNLRCLRVGDEEMRWESMGDGPVAGSEWMALNGDPDAAHLLLRSQTEAFPETCIEEIRQERLLSVDQDVEFPPCRVEIVLGAKGRLYVVLPTGVETALPFACNAPFIQDPARVKIKDPETSPTNRWLLQRVGALAGSAMLRWLQQDNASLSERAQAYGLFPDVDREDGSLEGTCGTMVEEAVGDAIDGAAFLLTERGNLQVRGRCVIVADELLDVWSEGQASVLLDAEGRPSLAPQVTASDGAKLRSWGVVGQLTAADVVSVLRVKSLPQPENWRGLLKLWAYVAPALTAAWPPPHASQVRIMPVQGGDHLHAAAAVSRFGDKRLLDSDADWDFLSPYLLVLNPNWPRWLAEQRRTGDDVNDPAREREVAAALSVLKEVGLDEASDLGAVIDRAATAFFARSSLTIESCVRLGQIAAKLAAPVGKSFRYVTKDGRLRAQTSEDLLFDSDGRLQELLPETLREQRLLHALYTTSFTSCTREEWTKWISSGRSGVYVFPRPKRVDETIWGRQAVTKEILRRDGSESYGFPYKGGHFVIEDWDFSADLWAHWEVLAQGETSSWVEVLGRILAISPSAWSSALTADALQVATNGSRRSISSDAFRSRWILKLRELPCLIDARGSPRKPVELLRRTPETEPFIDLEPFVHGSLDVEAYRPLLAALGVRDKPIDPARLIDILRAYARSTTHAPAEVDKWYRRLDQMLDGAATVVRDGVRKAFHDERLILAESGSWSNASGVFLTADEDDAPGLEVVRASVRELALWERIGVAPRPTVELALVWLRELPVGEPLSLDNVRRVTALQRRHPVRIWTECGHWLNLAREWAPTASLEYALTMQSLVEWSHLHEWVKQKTADIRLPQEIAEGPPFAALPRLARRIEDRFNEQPSSSTASDQKPWLMRLGTELCRVRLEDDAETERVRSLAATLSQTVWKRTRGLELIPYIGGAPAGVPRRADVAWLGSTLYVEELPIAKLARLVPDRLGRQFGRGDITAALNYCFGRSAAEVSEYVEENFDLVEAKPAPEHPDGEPTNAETQTEREVADRVNAAEGDAAGPSRGEVQPSEVAVVEPTEPDDAALTEVGERFNAESEGSIPPRPTSPRPQVVRVDLLERFATAQGFRRSGDGSFMHSDGSRIVRAPGDVFPWERRTATGELVRHYFPKEHCLEHGPLELDAAAWKLMDKSPHRYVLLLCDPDHRPVELSGETLRVLAEEKRLVLYPATYRLVLNDDERP